MRFASNDLVPLMIQVPRNLVPCIREALKLVREEERKVFGTDPIDMIQSEASCVLNLIFSAVDVSDWPKFDALLRSYGLKEGEAVEVLA